MKTIWFEIQENVIICVGKDADENETLLISSQQKMINSIEEEIKNRSKIIISYQKHLQ